MTNYTLEDAHCLTTSLLKAVSDFQFSMPGRNFKIGVSIGLVPISPATSNVPKLLSDADTACYAAKNKGRNRIHVYYPQDSELAQHHGEAQWIMQLNQALEDNRLCLFAQPIEPLDGRNEEHYELLIRAFDEHGAIVSPGAFLPAAERYNRMVQLDSWVIEQAFNVLVNNKKFIEQINLSQLISLASRLPRNHFLVSW